MTRLEGNRSKRYAAMKKAGFKTIGEAAKAARLSESYMGKLMRQGKVPYHRAKHLSALFNCSMMIFF